MLRLHDTATGEVRPLDLREPGKVSMYVCGPTVYDIPHLGHGRSLLIYDVLRRYLEWSGLEVRLVSNITDIDDQIIRRAADRDRSWEDVVAENEAAWYDAVDALGVQRPTADPHATAYVEGMVALIRELEEQGFAYRTNDGVWFEVGKLDGYGVLTRQSLSDLQAGARVEVTEDKRSPLDFALWKAAKPGEPTWPSPWGPGRPGWHTECVVMSLDLLGEGFDLHTGGLELRFPHHENERAQAVALGRAFSRHWMHHAFVEVEGTKMSKSLGNFTSLTDLLARTDARAYRLLVLQSHYRSPMEVTPTTVAQAEAALHRLDNFTSRAIIEHWPGQDPEADEQVLDAFRGAMDNDLDTPAATRLLFETVHKASAQLNSGRRVAPLVLAVEEIAKAFGLPLRRDVWITPETIKTSATFLPPGIATLIRRRDEARAGRDWAAADAARDELQAAGWLVEDTPAGTRVRRA